MNDKVFDNIKKNRKVDIESAIEDGSFFKYSIEWYFSIFASPIADKVFSLYQCAMLIFACYVSLSGVYHSFPISKEFQIISTNADSSKFSRVIKLNSTTDESSAVALSEYLVNKYIIAKESYSYYEMESRVNYVKNASSRSVFREYYLNYIDEKSPNSIFLKFQDNGVREVEIKSIKIITDQSTLHPYRASAVLLLKDQLSEDKSDHSTRRLEVIIDFDMPQLVLVKSGYFPFFFSVTRYSVISDKEIT